jgi:hypothetical protein
VVAKPFARSGGSFFSVITLFRYFPVIILGLRLAELTALGQVATPRELPPAAAREVATWIANQPRWSISAEAETSLGFKDNLLLSAKAPEASAFARSSWEALVLAVPRGKIDYTFFAQLGGTRFFSGQTVTHESEAWVQSEWGYRFSDTLKAASPLTGYYYDQVFDVSDLEVERLVARLKVGGLILAPSVRWSVHPALWCEVQAGGERKRYDGGTNDCAIGEGSLRAGWSLSKRLELRLEGRRRWRDFDQRVQYSRAGRALGGTRLKVAERELELRLGLELGEQKRWKLSTRLGGLQYEDNGSGYFGYNQKKISQELTWKKEAWSLRLDAAAECLEFKVQTAGIGIDPPPRIKEEFSLRARLERKITTRWLLFGAYTWERSRSNDRVASYRVNEGLLGAHWSWEK